MNELDPHLAALLRRGPPAPQALDPERHQAVVAAAKQAWFRQRANHRRNLIGLAAAAVFAAAMAGWTVRSLLDSPVQEAPAVMATADEPPDPPSLKRQAHAAELHSSPTAMPAAPAAKSAPAPVAAAEAVMQEAAMSALDAQTPVPVPIPAEHPERGRLLVARAVVEAAEAGRLAPAETGAALQAALELIAGIDHPAADALRQRLSQALRLR